MQNANIFCIMDTENHERQGADMEKKKTDYCLGGYAKRLLMLVLPLIIIQLVVLLALIIPLEGGELIKNQELIFTFFEGIGRGLTFMTIGALILDYWEKKHEKREE